MDLLRAAANSGVFRPKGLAACDNPRGYTGIRDWFLAGWGVEGFLSRYGEQMRGRPISAAADSPENSEYLERQIQMVRDGSEPRYWLSPLEARDDEYEATFLNAPDVGERAMAECAGWIAKRGFADLQVYGTIQLSVRDPGPWNWDNAFQMLYDYGVYDLGEPTSFPFVDLTAGSAPYEPDVTVVRIFSGSLVWMREWGALRGHVGPEDADQNLATFARLVDALVNNGHVGVRSAEMRFASTTFSRESDRILEAISPVVRVTADFS